MPKHLLLTVTLFFLLLSTHSHAATFQVGDAVTVETKENAYAAGKIVQVTSEAQGDVYLAGETVQINARVREDAFLAGQDVVINAPIGDDLHAFGETIIINSSVRGDVIAFGQKIVISPDARISGQVVLGAATIVADGLFDEDVRLMGADVTLNGLFLKNVTVRAGESVSFAEDADLRQDLLLAIPDGENVIVPNGVVRGEVKKEFVKHADAKKSMFPIIGDAALFFLLSNLLIGALLIVFARSFVIRFGEHAIIHKQFWKTLGIGFLLLIIPPFAGILLFFPFITIPLAIITIVGWGTSLYFGALLSGFLVVNILFPQKKGEGALLLFGKFAVCTLLLAMLHTVPFLGFLITFFVYIMSLGSLFLYKQTAMSTLRKAHLV